MKPRCIAEGCAKNARSAGYCHSHYMRFRRHGDPLAGLPTPAAKGAPKRFLLDVAMNHVGDDCLTWPYSTIRGYAQIVVDGKPTIASRHLCTLIHGEPPTPEHEAAHSCGRGHLGCVSPNHLSWKTAKENADDKLVHKTVACGERNGHSKLTAEEVREILALLRSDLTQATIASRFGVSPRTISKINVGSRWTHLQEQQQ